MRGTAAADGRRELEDGLTGAGHRITVWLVVILMLLGCGGASPEASGTGDVPSPGDSPP